MPSIGIVGAGISGLHLALRLRQRGLPTTVYTDRLPEEVAAGRLENGVIRFASTLARERALGVDHWNQPEYGWYGARLTSAGELPLDFIGRAEQPGQGVDFRLYLPRLMRDLTERGGVLKRMPLDIESILRLETRHDLVVVASGGRSAGELFPRDPDRSPFTSPQRRLCLGLYAGIEPMAEGVMLFQACPGIGEIFSGRFLHPEGLAHSIMIEAIPGGPLEHLTRLSYVDDRAAFRRELLTILAEHAPGLRERVSERDFDVVRPTDLLQGGITPTVRRGWARLPGGRYALALGDAWVTNDPIVAQGANFGSRCAFVLADAIMAGPPFDEAFCRAVELEMWQVGRPATEWSNAFLGPPQPHLIDLLIAANTDQRVADAYLTNFNDPFKQWEILSTPESTSAWLKGFARESADA